MFIEIKLQFINCVQADAPNHSNATMGSLASVYLRDYRAAVIFLVRRQILLLIGSFTEDVNLILSDSETCLSTKRCSFYFEWGEWQTQSWRPDCWVASSNWSLLCSSVRKESLVRPSPPLKRLRPLEGNTEHGLVSMPHINLWRCFSLYWLYRKPSEVSSNLGSLLDIYIKTVWKISYRSIVFTATGDCKELSLVIVHFSALRRQDIGKTTRYVVLKTWVL